jgi:hypothetical protein
VTGASTNLIADVRYTVREGRNNERSPHGLIQYYREQRIHNKSSLDMEEEMMVVHVYAYLCICAYLCMLCSN